MINRTLQTTTYLLRINNIAEVLCTTYIILNITCFALVPKITSTTSFQTSAIYMKTIGLIYAMATTVFTFSSVSTRFTFCKIPSVIVYHP